MTYSKYSFKKIHQWIVFFDVVKVVFVAFLVVGGIRLFVAEPFTVSGDSMAPTFSSNDFLIVDELTYEFNPPVRGDVVVFHYPLDPSVFFIKRLIGLPGDTVIVTNGSVFVKNSSNKIGHVLTEPYLTAGDSKIQHSTTTLGADEYFVLGDNRNSSFDSRVWGTVPRRYVVGRALFRLYPLTRPPLHEERYNFPPEEATTSILSTGK